MKYLVVIEKKALPASERMCPTCRAASAKTRRKVKLLIRPAIQLHVEDMRAHGYPIPKPTTAGEVVELQRA